MTIDIVGVRRDADTALRVRASRVIPGGMYGHLSVHSLPPGYPQFYESGSGAHLRDVDGNDYIDFMCAFGPMVLGYNHPGIDAAAAAQAQFGDTLGGPSARMVELAELLVATIDDADWAMFAKNGTDATALAVTIARAATGRSKLLKGRTAYHGANSWFSPNARGITEADRANIIDFQFNDVAALEAAVAEAGNDLAAIIVAPFMQDLPRGQYQDMIDAQYARAVREIADRAGAVLILDEVRTGFRLHHGSSWAPFGVAPDLAAFSKALGNGYAVSAVVGIDALKTPATEIFSTGSFWFSGVAMAAAIATINELREIDGVARMQAIGRLFMDGLGAQAAAHGFDVTISGPMAMPFMRFDADPEWAVADRFADEAIRRGVLLHPRHNWFVSTAHTTDDIDRALERTDEAFASVRASI